METIHNDKFIKFEYDPQTNKYRFPVNAVGAHDYYDIEEADFAPADATCIFVHAGTGNDSTGDGTSANPYATTAKGINETDETHVYVIRQDSIVTAEDISACTYDYFSGLYAASGATPKLSLRYIETELTDVNCVFVNSETGDDGDAGTEAAPKETLDGVSGAFSIVTTTKKYVKLETSDTYTIVGTDIPSDLAGIFSAIGKTPGIEISGSAYYMEGLISAQVLPISAVNLELSSPVSSEPLPDGNFIVVYKKGWNNYGRYNNCEYVIYSPDGSVVSGPTEFAPAAIWYGGSPYTAYSDPCAAAVGDDTVLLIYKESDYSSGLGRYWYGRLLDINTMVLGDRFSLFAANAAEVKGSAIGLENGLIAFAYQTGTNIYIKILDPEDSYSVVDSTVVSSANIENFGNISENSSGEIFICYMKSDGGYVYYYLTSIDSETLDEVLAETEIMNFSDAAGGYYPDIVVLSDDNIFYHYVKNSDRYYRVLSAENVTTDIIGETYIDGKYTLFPGGCCLRNGSCVLLSPAAAGTYISYMDMVLPYRYLLPLTSEMAMEGLNIAADSNTYLKRIFSLSSAKLTLKWCTIQDAQNETEDYDCTVIVSDDEVIFNNSIIRDSDIGIVADSNKVDVSDSHFIRINNGYAIDIDGEAASSGDIIIEHCDMFNCNGGIRLQNNGGTNEIVKNNIIHDIDNYAIDADEEITCDNSVVTGSVNNVNISGSASYIKANPLYMDEGGIDPNDTDLNVKVKVLGDVANSPAYGLGDDSRNAGAIDVKYIGSITTWSSLRIIKPLAPDTGIVPINPVSSVKRAASYKDGDARILSLKWASEALTADELEDLTSMVCCLQTNGLYAYLVRLYPDPDTLPDSYYLYAIDFTKTSISESAAAYMQTEDGVLGNELVLMRRFEA